LPTTYKILSDVLPSKLILRAKNYWNYRCGFRLNRMTANHIFDILQELEKKWEYNEAEHQLFVDCKKVYNSVMREVFCIILIEFSIPMQLARLIKLCLNSIAQSGKANICLPIKNGLKQVDAFSPLLFNFFTVCH
jgi:hypothetical protein